MEIAGKKVMVLGATGMVGQAICRELALYKPSLLILTSLYEHELTHLTEMLVQEFREDLPPIKVSWGNSFVRTEWKDLSRQEMLGDTQIRQQLILDMVEPLTRETLEKMELHHLCLQHKPDIIIDTINFVSTLPYANIFDAAKEGFNTLKKCQSEKHFDDVAAASIEKLLLSQYTPQITKHIQILFQSMLEAQTRLYLKTGNIGTGVAGMKIPYTHTLDNPPQALLAKSALAGAHTLLLFLMSQNPNGPVVKEVKPVSNIAWKRIGFGPITHRGRAVLLEDVGLSDAVSLSGKLSKIYSKKPKHLKYNGEPRALTAPFIDLGESSLFALGEFEVLTDEGQLEFLTPEEVAQAVVSEVEGDNTVADVIAGLEQSTLHSTYRAGFMREQAIRKLKEVIKNSGVDSVAFELLGPPRLSKLLYEAHLLQKVYGNFETVSSTEAATLSKDLEKFLMEKPELRSQIISVGLPILLPKGDKILRGSRIAIPSDLPGKSDAQFEITPATIDKWAYDGWIDLRLENMQAWQKRLQTISEEIQKMHSTDSSSSYSKDATYWNHTNGNTPIDISKLASWVLKMG
ncbi:MAG: short-chain dehydrogenase [Deltaproteobacteria bacterium]|nr:short-chain dehydrogenase [Deltaproteobacteria bacterium]